MPEAAPENSRADDAQNQKETSSPKSGRRQRNKINEITDAFLSDIRSLEFAQTETSKALIASIGKHSKTFTNYVGNFPSSSSDDKTRKYSVPVEKIGELTRLIHDLSASAGSLPLSYRGLFLVLVSKWDAYFASILRWVYRTEPKIIDGSNRVISFAELKQINSIELAQSKVVEDEIAAVLRESHGDQFAYLEKKLNLALKKLDIWTTFVELTQRRNLIAHTDGRVSFQYLQICNDAGVKLDPSASVGSELEVHPDYFEKSCDCLAELGFKLSQVLWRKLLPSEINKAESHLSHTTFEMIKASQYNLAIRILDFALHAPMKFTEARHRYVCIINLAQAHKWSGQESKCVEIIDAEDWSAASLDFRLAAAVLKNDFTQAISIMKRIGVSGDVRKEDYQDWPLFKELRKTTTFVETYREIFKTESEIRDVPNELTSSLNIDPSASKNIPKSVPQIKNPKPKRSPKKTKKSQP